MQRAGKQDKPIVEIRRQEAEPPFPGFMAFQTTIGGLQTIPQSWRTALRAAKGVYLLVSLKTGGLYVGSASGVGGFWERWECYARNGHGGNEALKLDPHTEYQVTILETAPSSAMTPDIIALENRWKDKLRSRDDGHRNRPESAASRRMARERRANGIVLPESALAVTLTDAPPAGL